jgi:shikimate dehydrogenase
MLQAGIGRRARQAWAVEGHGMTRQILLLGYPVAHSISPAFQQAALDHHSIEASYSARSTAPERLGEEIDLLRGDDCLGANLTIPHKEQVGPLLDEIDPWAHKLGAVNTIVKDGGRLIGHNTDASAFIKTLKERAGFEPKGKSILLIGAGGAARSAAFSLAGEGIAALTIANRTASRARALARDVAPSLRSVEALPMEENALAEAAARADLIVNATSMGMGRGEGQELSPLDATLIPSEVLVYDMVYTPPDTPLILEARRAGARTLGGLWMLIYQGAAAFELWTGREAPVDVMYAAGEKALASSARNG